MKKLLLILAFSVSPLVAMRPKVAVIPPDESAQEGAVQMFAANWLEWQQAMKDYCDVPEGAYDALFAKMARESAESVSQNMMSQQAVLIETLKQQAQEDEESDNLPAPLRDALFENMGELARSVAQPEHMQELAAINLRALAYQMSRARKEHLSQATTEALSELPFVNELPFAE